MMNIQPNETSITGKWIIEDGKLVADAATNRINYLTANVLVEVARSEDGWSILYRDNNDGRFWELSYPDSEQHGAGAPYLRTRSECEIAKNYKLAR